MEQVEDVQRYRKVIDTIVHRHIRGQLETVKGQPLRFETKSEVRAWAEAVAVKFDGVNVFVKSMDNIYDVDGTTLIGWEITFIEFEWVERKPKAEPKQVAQPKVEKVRQVRTHYQNGKPIVRARGKVVSKRRGSGSTLATKVVTTSVAPITAEQLAERRERLRGSYFTR